MSHINVKTDNLENPYIEKVFLTQDHKSYISLNSGQVVYYDGNNIFKQYQFNMGKRAYKMLEYLIENNDRFVSSESIYYEVFGCDDSAEQDEIVDQTRNTLCRIACIKNSDVTIKKHTMGECSLSGYTLTLPDQKQENSEQGVVDDVASQLWKTRPFYLDREMITKLFYQEGGQEPDYNTDLDTYMIIQLSKKAYNTGEDVSLELLEKVVNTRLVSIKDFFVLKDLYANGKHIEDFNSPMELLDIDEEKITFVFCNCHESVKIHMMLGGAKTFLPMRHLIPIVFNTDRKFNFRVLGFIDKLNNSKTYAIKPICITYI